MPGGGIGEYSQLRWYEPYADLDNQLSTSLEARIISGCKKGVILSEAKDLARRVARRAIWLLAAGLRCTVRKAPQSRQITAAKKAAARSFGCGSG